MAGVKLTKYSSEFEFRGSPYLFNYLYILDSTVVFGRGPLEYLIDKFSIEYPGVIAEFDLRCKKQSPENLQRTLKSVIKTPLKSKTNINTIKDPLLALFHYCSDINEDMLEKIERKIKEGQRHYSSSNFNDISRYDYIQWVRELYQQREKEPFYQNWTKYVEQAKQALGKLGAELNVQKQEFAVKPSWENDLVKLQFLEDAFSQQPVLLAAMDNEEKILKILQHYYRRPGPERVISSLISDAAIPEVWKPMHASSHVLRARNNVLWYIEWLEKFQPLSFSDDENSLLMLAIIYHDAAAEDVLKKDEEKKSADYFKRDLAGLYPQALLDNVALALESKENDIHPDPDDQSVFDDSVRRYQRVLRFADRMDIIRCTGVGQDFLRGAEASLSEFNPGLLDLPPALSEQFTADPEESPIAQRHLEAAMHGAADLAAVTGHLVFDHRPNSYASEYGLVTVDKKLTEQFESTVMPVSRMDNFINDNVRRKIAQLAGIKTCSDPNHKECSTDKNAGVTWGIHNSWYDLKKIRIPDGMTHLEKMQCEHSIDVLSEKTQEDIKREVERLKSEGIPMNLGTLTQETLRSEQAKKVLKGRGILAEIEPRRRGYDQEGNESFEEVLYPSTEISRPDAVL